MSLSLKDAIEMGLKNNLDIQVAEKAPLQREQDVVFQQAAFDPNIGGSAFKSDNSQPSQNFTDIGAFGTVVAVDSTVNDYRIGFSDPLHWGASYSANLEMTRFTSTSNNAIFPTTYQTALELAYNQSLLRNFGNKANESLIVIAQNNYEVSRSQFRDQVLGVLNLIEDAYWELVFARQDLEVKNESLRLAEELLKLNRIKVQVGTLPPIEITQAEAEVASREQGVIVAENLVRDNEDALRKVLNMPKTSEAWERPITPTDQPEFIERPVNLQDELQQAVSRRPDLEQARLNIKSADTQLAFDHSQRKWDLNFRATYTLQGLSGDVEQKTVPVSLPTACDDSGIDGIPGTLDAGEGDGICQPAQPPTGSNPGGPGEAQTLSTFQFNQFSQGDLQNESFLDALEFIRDRDFESWSVSLSMNVPIGNRSADSRYINSRLSKERSEITYQNVLLGAEVEVRTAARAIVTNKKRIEAAEKNVELQRKKVEAEQKKFENGMSTSFQVLTFQEDLTEALGTKNRALVDYRKSLTSMEKAKGTLDDYLKVAVR